MYMYALRVRCLLSVYYLCVHICMHVRVCVSSLSLVMTSFDWNIVSYWMSVDDHSDCGMKGDH